MDIYCFIVPVKTDDVYKDIAEDVDTSNHELEQPLLKGKNKKVIGLMKDELDGKTICKIKTKNLQLLTTQKSASEKKLNLKIINFV